MKKERLIFADVIRAIAIIFVILIHTTCNYAYELSQGTKVIEFNILLILEAVLSIAVVLFFMVSGCFLIRKENDINKNHWKKIGKRVFQLLFWTTAYLIFLKYYRNWDIDLGYSLKAMFFNVQVSHMWFLYPLIALYILSPIVSKLYYALSKKQINYLLIVTFLVPLVVKTFSQFFSFVSIPLFAVGFSEFGYFLLGKYIYDNKSYLKKKIKWYVPIIMSLMGILLIYVYAKLNITSFGIADKPYSDYSRFPVAFYCLSFYLMIVLLEDKLTKIPSKIKSFFTITGSNSNGIYLIHMFVIYLVGNIYLGPIGFTSNAGNLVFMILGGLLYFVITWIVVFFIKKIPYINKLIN